MKLMTIVDTITRGWNNCAAASLGNCHSEVYAELSTLSSV
jgi:hypothetical protein